MVTEAAVTPVSPEVPGITAEPPKTPDANLTPDDLALRTAEAELAAAEATQVNADTVADPQAQASPETAAPKVEGQTGKIEAPKDDLENLPEPVKRTIGGLREAAKAERQNRHKAEMEVARLTGVVQALSVVGKGQQPQAAAPQKTAKEQIADLREKLISEAERADKGEISLKDWKISELAIQDEIDRITEAARPQPKQVRNDDLYLQRETQRIEQQHAALLTAVAPEELEDLVPLAFRQAQREGRPIQRGTAAGDLDLRLRVVNLAIKNFGDRVPRTSTQPQPKTAPAKLQLSATAQAREAGMKRAETHPPNVAEIGRAGSPADESPEAMLKKFETMHEDDLLNMMDTNPALFEKLSKL
jgi:hypothetical protein